MLDLAVIEVYFPNFLLNHLNEIVKEKYLRVYFLYVCYKKEFSSTYKIFCVSVEKIFDDALEKR